MCYKKLYSFFENLIVKMQNYRITKKLMNGDLLSAYKLIHKIKASHPNCVYFIQYNEESFKHKLNEFSSEHVNKLIESGYIREAKNVLERYIITYPEYESIFCDLKKKIEEQFIQIEYNRKLIMTLVDSGRLNDAQNLLNKLLSKSHDCGKLFNECKNALLIAKKKQRIDELIKGGKLVDAENAIESLKGVVGSNLVFGNCKKELQDAKSKIKAEYIKKIDQQRSDILNGRDIDNSSLINLFNNTQIPSELKINIKQTLERFNNDYEIGIIPSQQIVKTTYKLPDCTNKFKYYSFYTTPIYGTTVYPYRRRKVNRRGYSELIFEKKLKEKFSKQSNYNVLGDVALVVDTNSYPFEPDIAIVENDNKFGIRIDIEIDEPYSGLNKEPIHYIGCGDKTRDLRLANLGWIVIRFSEKQIVKEPDACVSYINKIIHSIDNSFYIDVDDKSPIPDKCWSELDVKKMVAADFREKLLNHQFGVDETENISPVEALTQQEKIVLSNSKGIGLINKNINNGPLQFAQDGLISFIQDEHVYLYEGKVPLTPVSNILKLFFYPFDIIAKSCEIAKRIAAKEGRPFDISDQNRILEEWDLNGAESRELGTFLHKQIENNLKNKDITCNYHFVYKGQFYNVDETISIEREYIYFKDFLSKHNLKPIRIEWPIFDKELNIAGTIDMLCKNGDSYDLYDWKRSKKASPLEKVWSYGINGLEDVADISFYHYALQQNLYKYILEKNYNINVGKMYIVVLHREFNNYLKYEIPLMQKEIDIIVQYINTHHC